MRQICITTKFLDSFNILYEYNSPSFPENNDSNGHQNYKPYIFYLKSNKRCVNIQ